MQVEQARVLASSLEIVSLCEEFPDAPIILVAQHAIAHGAATTRLCLRAERNGFSSLLDRKSL